MLFAEKLSFLIHLTRTTNKELAAELSVDPSLISLMRTGKRKLFKDPAQTKKMASFFAKRCPAAFQRQALSEMLGQSAISSSMPTELLAECLGKWLQGDSNFVGTLLSGIQSLPAEIPDIPLSMPAPVPAPKNQTRFFYGEEGRREAMYQVMQEMQSMPVPGDVLTVIDDNLEWLLSDYSLTKKIRAALTEVMDRGFTFYQIMPPLNFINRYAESLQFWLPMYATGRMKVYYYPRLRGNLYRHSIIVVPGRCVQYAAAVGVGSTSDITMFSTDLQLVTAFEKQFQEHLSLCRPSLTAHKSPAGFAPCFSEYFSTPGDIIQSVNTLSVNSMPRELPERFIQKEDPSGVTPIFQLCLEELPHFEKHLLQHPYIDMCRLASAEAVRSGKVPIASPTQIHAGQPCYTPETYSLHLKNILRLMDQYENYSFLPLHEKECPDYNLFTGEGEIALIVRTAEPFIILEIRRPAMTIAFQESLLRKADSIGYGGINREKIRMELRSLIQELES
ncbi:MAG: hypothetical protein ACI4I8_00845 [Oscillospiraceae bacterium]